MEAVADEKTIGDVNPYERYYAIDQFARSAGRLVGRTTDNRTTPTRIPDPHEGLISANIKYLSSILIQLRELLQEEEADEHGALRPTAIAYETACALLIDTQINLKKQSIPYGSASTDANGNIHIQWNKSGKKVTLVIPVRDRAAYVYHKEGDSQGTVAATPASLARLLESLD